MSKLAGRLEHGRKVYAQRSWLDAYEQFSRADAEESPQRIGVRADLARDLLDRTRAVCERVRDAQLGDNGDRSGGHSAAH